MNTPYKTEATLQRIKPAGYLFGAIIGLSGAFLYILIASHHLNVQGLYYDEVFQAPASFWYIGKPQDIYSISITKAFPPILNIPYTAAIKSALYGLYLKCTNDVFTVFSWRMTGIIITACGIFSFSILVARTFTSLNLVVFLILFLTDTMVLLATRHDWGPVALALCIRLGFLGLFIRTFGDKPLQSRHVFLMAFLIGIAILEKLSSLVLLGPLALFLICDTRSHKRQHLFAAFTGLCLGCLPLAIINGGSLLLKGYCISFNSIHDAIPNQGPGISEYFWQLLCLGSGKLVRSFIFGETVSPVPAWVEGSTLAALVIIGIVLMIHFNKDDKKRLQALLLLGAYLIIAIGLQMLPRTTSIHHWIIATPFQYAFLALTIGASSLSIRELSAQYFFRSLFVVLSVILVVSRVPIIIDTYKALSSGHTDPRWDPSLTQLGMFAGKHVKGTTFITADWGVGTQILCLSNGSANLLAEAWNRYNTQVKLDSLVHASPHDTFYLVLPRIGITVADSSRSIIINSLNTMRGLRKGVVEPEGQEFNAAALRKFIRQTEDDN